MSKAPVKPYQVIYEYSLTRIVGPGVDMTTSASAAAFEAERLNRAFREGVLRERRRKCTKQDDHPCSAGTGKVCHICGKF